MQHRIALALSRHRLRVSCSPRARPSLGRLSSTATVSAKPDFSSYFLHNARPPSETPRAEPLSIPPDHPDPLGTGAYPPPASLAAYRTAPVLTPARLLSLYAQLSKSRLSILVVLTAMSGVALSPLTTTVPVLLSTALGTALCAASANTLNQLQEIPFDAQMARTRNRPLVRRALSPAHAAGFAVVTGVAGPALLWTMVNPTTALLGAANIVLYAGVYTWMKRRTVWNTPVGSIVGGIPPLMGWTACGGQLLPSTTYPIATFLPPFLTSAPLDLALIDNPLAPLALFMLLYSWQLAHFNPLSHLVRTAYAQAGYHMLCILAPKKNQFVALRHAALLTAICSVLVPLSGLTTWTFALTSLVPNAIVVRAAWDFWKFGGDKYARKLFQHTLWYLPVILGLMMLHKQGLEWRKWVGLGNDEKEEDATASQS
ncbi:protoheme IX farnesyltransferase [Artomyces pyxidatus]|uniref:Protoheme IX farnesyltransferase n=1 Tax=Artomyces pyxidatus TaxID=48021 RepID=A0ACB8STZ1_9AGAM|nr:protoheme IX farnesyltransferase [Artomyces pyxidatus]